MLTCPALLHGFWGSTSDPDAEKAGVLLTEPALLVSLLLVLLLCHHASQNLLKEGKAHR